ncbi:MAG: CPBP family intramembrane metalloprotease, partial [Eggerthellaceae bacterium]|nr:CPBP family intramembrane metalloprotease [Eggerthellaceae bacterium]
MKRIIIFCVITFCITYALEFGLVYPLVETANQEGADALSATIATLALSSVMLIPALGVVLTRLITKEGFKNTLIKPVEFKRSFKYYLLGWFGPVILIVIGAAVYYLVFSADFDSSMPLLLAATEGQEAGSDSLFSIQALILMQFLVGILIAPLLNILTCFGEEWGWRG